MSVRSKKLTLLLCLFLFVFSLTGCTDDSDRLSFSAEKVFTLSHPIERSYQGAAAYGKYLFQFSDHMENVGVYDLDEKVLLDVVTLEKNELYHCNNANFGAFFDENDEFPLLYVSMENIDAHCALVFRVTKTDNEFSLTQVQTVVYPDPNSFSAYYPNCVIDAQNGYLYVVGYTQKTYKKKVGNAIAVNRFSLPDPNVSVTYLQQEDCIERFEVESVTATQGALVLNGVIYQVYGFENNSFFKVLDPKSRAFTASVRLPKHKFKSEPECLVYYDGFFYCVDVTGAVYKFSVQV